jgi:predicted secreted acid phosphatase
MTCMLKLHFCRHLLLVAGLTLGLPAAEPLNLTMAKQAVIQYVEAGDYEMELTAVANRAGKWIETRAAQRAAGEKLALVLDIDETSLLNLQHMREMDFGYVPTLWDAWVAEGSAPAIKPVRQVFQTARRLDVTVFFITGRKESDRPGTEKNLTAAGFGDYHILICKPANYPGSSARFKTEERQRLETEGWTIIANIGDQASDLAGGAAEKTFKLPNPFYQIQ